MADTKISALTAASALDGTETYPVVQSTNNRKVTSKQQRDYTANSLVHGGYVSGSNYSPYPFVAPGSGAAIGAGSIRLLPMMLIETVTIDQLAARVATPFSGGLFQLAIYASSPTTKLPTGNALISTGSLSTTTSGQNIPGSVTATALGPGLYWAAINVDNGTAVFSTIPGTTLLTPYHLGTATLSEVNGNFVLVVSQAFGTWPDLTSATITHDTAATKSAIVYFRKQ